MADLSESFDPLDNSDAASSALALAAAASDTASKASDTASKASVAAAKGSDASSKIAAQSAAWEAGATPDEILDADSDTKVQVEESADEDVIRFDTGGTERLVINDGWIDQQFNNILKNGSFEDSTLPGGFSSGWALEGTPTVAVETTNIAVGYGTRSIKITATGAGNEGLNQTITGLKVSTSYTILWHSMATAGDTARLLTTGATTNVDTDVTATSMTQSVGTFVTDGSGTDVVLKVVAKADTDIVYFDNIIVVEGLLAPTYHSHPNDQHLKAIDYQDSTPTNYDYGALRMECGYVTVATGGAPGAWANTDITFGTAFTVALSANTTNIYTASHKEVCAHNVTLTTTGFTASWRHGDATNLTANQTLRAYWIAIGVGP